MRKLLLAVVTALIIVAVPTTASASVKWLCGPGVKKDPCAGSLKTTVFSTWDNKLRVVNPAIPAKPKIDCFYVYPTVSNQKSDLATKAVDPEIHDIALFQAARYSQTCRVFAPVYRQVTVQGLNDGHYDAAPGDKDLLEAWKQYLSKYNKGRGFVLIGHSQGSFRLTTLIQKQIDKNAKIRKQLISAILLGGNETVKNGSDRGGSFHNVPACHSLTQLHCLIAYSTYNQTPPSNSLFGRTTVAGQHVVCTNPASLRANARIDLDAEMPSTPFAPGTLIAAGISLLHIDFPKVSTPWVEAKASFTGRCATENGATFLKLASLKGTPVPSPSPDATWGLHLVDANIAVGDLVNVVKAEEQTYLH